MKKTGRKLLLSSIALVATLALTVTSTYAWFNMNTSVTTDFDVSITTDDGFQVFIKPFAYSYTDNGDITTPDVALNKSLYEGLGYRDSIQTGDFGELFSKHYLAPSTLNRGTADAVAEGPISFRNVKGLAYGTGNATLDSGQDPITKPLQLDASGKYNVPFIKFRVYFRSTLARTISLDFTSNIISNTTAETVTKFPITNLAYFKQLLAATSYSGDVSGDFSVTTADTDGYLEGTVASGVLTGGNVMAADYLDAYRIAFETTKATGTDSYKRAIYDKKDSTSIIKENAATTNIGWIYYNDGSTTNNSSFKKPVTLDNANITNFVSLEKVDGSEHFYGYTDVTIWLEGFDNDCFNSISGLAANFKIRFTSTPE